MTVAVAAGLVTGGGLLVSGLVLLRLYRRLDLSAVLLAGTGLLLALGAASSPAGPRHVDRILVAAGLGLLLPLAIACYPVLRLRHPVDVVCLAVMAGGGLSSVVWHSRSQLGTMVLVTGSALLVHTWWRFERATGVERRALTWLVLGLGSAFLVAFLSTFATDTDTGTAVGSAGLLVLGPAMYVGSSRPDVVDVRGLITGVVSAAVAVIVFVSAFVGLLALVDALDGPGGSDLSAGVLGLLGAVAAFAFHPTQLLLRSTVDQLLFGTRPDPLGAAGAVAGRIGDDPADALRAIREALVLPYAALRVDGVPLVSTGEPVTHTRRIPLGEDPDDPEGAVLVVGLRPGDLGLSRGDQEVLRLVAPLLAQTLRARALTRELLESRGQRVAAVEEERRRLRRDLHDGLGPRLSGIAFTADAVRNLLRHDPAAAEELLVTLRQETSTAIEDIRRLVYAMRPPALDELGLVPALRQQTVGLRSRDGEVLTVSVTAPEQLPALPAAVEVAAYRIVTEALTNVARHSAARAAAVDLRAHGAGLTIEVSDEGGPAAPVGPASWQAGVGLVSMRERAAELGGTLDAGPGPHGGRVTALLPLTV